MRVLSLAVAVVGFAIALAGCGPSYSTKYSFTPPPTPEGRMCAMQCLNTQSMCQQSCKSSRQSCESTARLRAERDYNRYVAEQTRAQQPVKKSVSDFYNGYSCSSDETSCEAQCESTYRSCYQICGGKVSSQQVCTAFCDEAQVAAGSTAYPKGLGQAGRDGFDQFKAAKEHKAFAVSATGAWGWRSGLASADEAKAAAKAACESHTQQECVIVAVDGQRLD